jgi:hypothetical protein
MGSTRSLWGDQEGQPIGLHGCLVSGRAARYREHQGVGALGQIEGHGLAPTRFGSEPARDIPAIRGN